MKHDNLERFILEHREEFDTAHPPLRLWAGIERQLPVPAHQVSGGAPQDTGPARVIPMLSRLKYAAAVAALLVIGFTGGMTLANQRQTSAMADIERVNPDFRDAERYYTGQINDKLQLLASYGADKQAVLEDLDQVDAIMEELKQELSGAPSGAEEQIVANLIISYRNKLDILEKVLESIQAKQQYQSKTQNNEIGI